MFPMFDAVVHNRLDILALSRRQTGVLGDVMQLSFQMIEVLLRMYRVVAAQMKPLLRGQ